jgi:FG-GAP-like repeat
MASLRLAASVGLWMGCANTVVESSNYVSPVSQGREFRKVAVWAKAGLAFRQKTEASAVAALREARIDARPSLVVWPIDASNDEIRARLDAKGIDAVLVLTLEQASAAYEAGTTPTTTLYGGAAGAPSTTPNTNDRVVFSATLFEEKTGRLMWQWQLVRSGDVGTHWDAFRGLFEDKALGDLLSTGVLLRCQLDGTRGAGPAAGEGTGADCPWQRRALPRRVGGLCPCPTPPPKDGCACVVPPPLPPVLTKCPVFLPNVVWSTVPYFGEEGTFFADVTGDGKADAIVVNKNQIVVRPSLGSSFGPNEWWLDAAFHGEKGIFFADVDGDGKADAIFVSSTGISVRRSTDEGFGPLEVWSPTPYYGEVGTFFADVNGDGKADAIVVNASNVGVQLSDGTRFTLPNKLWSSVPYSGEVGTFFVDVTGDGKADAVIVNGANIEVRQSTGTGFQLQSAVWSASFHGDRGTFFADVDGDGRADAIAVTDAGVLVKRSTGSAFAKTEAWTRGVPYYGDRGTFFADVNGDGALDAIVVNDSVVVARMSDAYELCVVPGP